ncbi:MAG TPA: helicase-associated domain-containing protein [Actinomycetaceae bacterium]|nr:helicase-associated domain-containing protein [Actinomycetaceae bacterium]
MTPAGTPHTARAADLVRHLERRSTDELVDLLVQRPDLAVPAPASLGALAGRALTRSSIDRALADLNSRQLAVVEALCALSRVEHPSAPRLAAALELAVGDVEEVLDVLAQRALIVEGRPVLTLAEACGPYPAGVGPPLDPPQSPAQLAQTLAEASPEARHVVSALAQGSPVGLLPEAAAESNPGPAEATRWLLERGLLHRLDDERVVLPLEVGLAQRDGRLPPGRSLHPPDPPGANSSAEHVAASAALQAEEFVRLTAELLASWENQPPQRLRAGGLPSRELRRAAAALGLELGQAAVVIETAATAGLIAPGGRTDADFVPTAGAMEWAAREAGEQWAQLVAPWSSSPRAAWLVGSRDDRGTLRAALSADVERGWVPRLRRRFLRTLAHLPEGSAPDSAELREILAWHAPRAPVSEESLAAVAAEAELLGFTGGGALSPAGRLILQEGAAHAELAAALEGALPPRVDELIIQGDLTGIVPGRPTAQLAKLLADAAEVESRGGGLTVRFSADSLRRAIELGRATVADELRAHSITPLPQALEYLIADAVRDYDTFRVGAAGSYVSARDEAAAQELLARGELGPARLQAVSPTVLVSPLAPHHLATLLREAGVRPLLDEEPPAPGPTTTTRRTAPAPANVVNSGPDRDALTDLVGRLRRAEAQVGAMAPGHIVALLREAATAAEVVSVVMAEAGGHHRTRLLRPLTVIAGRARMEDPAAGTEVTVAVHRIASVTSVPPPPRERIAE